MSRIRPDESSPSHPADDGPVTTRDAAPDESEALALAEAARGPRQQCRRLRHKIRRRDLRLGYDPKGRPARLERILGYVEEHFCEGDLTVGSASRAVGVTEPVGGALRDYSKYSLDQFLDKLRVDTARHLLLNTRIKVVTVGFLVGFRTFSTFVRTYQAWTGERPDATREQYAVDPYAGVSADLGIPREWRRLLDPENGAPREAGAMREELVEIYPERFGARRDGPRPAGPEPVLPALDAEAFERFRATELWPRLADLPFAQQQEIVRAWPFWTPAPFRFLHRKAREVGRRDRRRGVELARLALDSLEGNDERLGPRVRALEAEGWAWLANAQRLDLDFRTAEASFRHAEGILDLYELKDAWVAGVFYLAKGTLRMFERRHDEAIRLFDEALPRFDTAGDVRNQVRTLHQRTASLSYANRFSEIQATLRKATALLQETPDEGLSLLIANATISSLVQAGEFHRAETYFREIVGQIGEIEEPVWRYQFQWARARIDHGIGRLAAAEEKYLASWQGFQAHNRPHYSALVALDLSLFYSEKGEPSKVLAIAPAIGEFFEGLQLYDETLAALRMLNDAVARTEVPTEVLREVRSQLWRDPLATSN